MSVIKKLGAFFAAVLVVFYASSAMADLIVVRKPESKNSATLKTTYGITGTGKNGVKVAYYRFNGSAYVSVKNGNGTTAQTTVGKAGVFYKQVSLSEGHNKFAVRADAGGAYQVVYFDINVLRQEIMNNVSNGIQSLYNGWIN